MKKITSLTLIGLLVFCVSGFAKHENISNNAAPVVIYGKPTGGETILPIKVSADGTVATSAVFSGTIGEVDQGTGGSSAWLVTGTGGTFPVTGTFWQATQPVSIADGSAVTMGAKADARSTATDTTAVSALSVLKQISYMEQNPVSRYVTNTGLFPVDLNPPANMGSGQTTVTTAGTRVALAGSQVCLSVTVKAKKTNTGLIYVGTAAGVSSSVGFILSPGDTVTVDVDNLADVGLDSSVNAEGVSYIYATK